MDLLPFYRERVFPAVEDAGFVPVTADDVVSSGDSVSAKLDSLIDRAAVMVIELSTAWTRAEFRMALARLKGAEADSSRRKQLHLIVVVAPSEQIPPAAQEFLVLRRPDELSDTAEEFGTLLGQQLRQISDEMGIERVEEPRRLFDAKEYRAAVISAMSLLEAKLRDQLNKRPWPDAQRPMSMQSLVKLAFENDLLRAPLRMKIDGWIRARNGVVHSSMVVTKAQAREIVDGVLELVRDWN